MSSTQSFTFDVTLANKAVDLYGDGYADMSQANNLGIVSGSNREGYVVVNPAKTGALFPRSHLRPTKIKAVWTMASNISNANNFTELWVHDMAVKRVGSTKETTTTYESSGSDAANFTPDKMFSFTLHTKTKGLFESTSWVALGGDEGLHFTLYFLAYDFSAAGSTGVTASVSSATGYDGDTITFTAAVQSGYAFDGWYNGSTKVSGSLTYQHTVSGGDLSLTAKAVPTTKTVTVKYNGATIATETLTPPVSVRYNGTQIASVGSGETKTLSCGGKIMSGNVTVGGKTLACDGKVMNGNVTISVS